MEAFPKIEAVLQLFPTVPESRAAVGLSPRDLPGLEHYRREACSRDRSNADSVRKIAAGIRTFLKDRNLDLKIIKKQHSQAIVVRVVHDPSGEIVQEYPVISMIRVFFGTDRYRGNPPLAG